MSELWVERHRPRTVGDIKGQRAVVERLKAYAQKRTFPHLLFAGPPGTGKTTAAIALARDVFGEGYRTNMLEMNASDERKLESIRTKVKSFARTAPVPGTTFKVIFLDEADALTSDAQGALRRIIETYTFNTRFCLICNYISKIDEGLQNEFIRLRFNQLPKEDIIGFLKQISDTEKLNMSQNSLSCIQKLYRSDIRSMINFIQSNQDIVKNHSEAESSICIIDNDVWETLFEKLTKREKLENNCAYVHLISIKYNIDKKNIIKDFLNYIIRNCEIKNVPE